MCDLCKVIPESFKLRYVVIALCSMHVIALCSMHVIALCSMHVIALCSMHVIFML